MSSIGQSDDEMAAAAKSKRKTSAGRAMVRTCLEVFMRFSRRGLIVGLGALAAVLLNSPPIVAHHSTAMYNMATPVTVTGVVKRFEWTNPHAFVFLEVKDDSGQTVEWEIEMMSLNHLRGYGWVRDTVKPGDVISCTGGAAKSGAPSMISSYMKLADGRMIKS